MWCWEWRRWWDNVTSPVIPINVLFCDYLPRHSKSVYWSSDNKNKAKLYIFALSCLLIIVVLSISTLSACRTTCDSLLLCHHPARIWPYCHLSTLGHLHMPLNSASHSLYWLLFQLMYWSRTFYVVYLWLVIRKIQYYCKLGSVWGM